MPRGSLKTLKQRRVGDRAGGGFVYRARRPDGQEIRTVSLATYLSSVLSLLTVTMSLAGFIFGGENEREQIIEQFRADVKEAEDRLTGNLEREKGVAETTHKNLDKRIDDNQAAVRSLNDRFIDHVARSTR